MFEDDYYVIDPPPILSSGLLAIPSRKNLPKQEPQPRRIIQSKFPPPPSNVSAIQVSPPPLIQDNVQISAFSYPPQSNPNVISIGNAFGQGPTLDSDLTINHDVLALNAKFSALTPSQAVYTDANGFLTSSPPSGGGVNLTSANGVKLTPEPITDTGIIGLVTTLKDTSDTTRNVAVGNTALTLISPTVTNSTAVGSLALDAQTAGTYNSAFGTSALASLTTGSDNTAVGTNALNYMTTNVFNTALGATAGQGLLAGDGNTFIGCGAGNGDDNISYCTLLGFNTKASPTIVGSTVIGQNATVTESSSIVLGTTGDFVGLTIPAPSNALHFQGVMQQTPSTRPPSTINDLKKGQLYGSLLTVSPGSTIIFQYPIHIGNPTVGSTNFYKVDILFNSNISGNTPNSCYTTSTAAVSYQVSNTSYSLFVSDSNLPVYNQNTLVDTLVWSISGTDLIITATWAAGGQQVQYVVNYETFGAQN